MHQLMNYYLYFDLLLNTNNKTILQLLQARQKKWYGHGRTGRTADYGLATIALHLTLNNSEIVRDRGLVLKDYQQEMAYVLSNGHVTDDVT